MYDCARPMTGACKTYQKYSIKHHYNCLGGVVNLHYELNDDDGHHTNTYIDYLHILLNHYVL